MGTEKEVFYSKKQILLDLSISVRPFCCFFTKRKFNITFVIFFSIFSGSDELKALLTLIETPHESESEEVKDVGSIKAKQWPTGCPACSQLQTAETEKLEKFR